MTEARRDGVEQREAYQRVKGELMTKLVDNIQLPFPQVELIEAMQVFKHQIC